MDPLNSFLLFIIGWLSGLFSPLIVDWFRHQRDKEEVKKGIVAELLELQFRLANVVYLLSVRHGTRDKAVIDWLLPRIENYPGAREEKSELLRGFKWLASFSDEQIGQLNLLGRDEESKVKAFPKLSVPFLDSKINYVSSFSIEFQYELLELRTDISLYNETVDGTRLFFEMTFNPSAMETNGDAITNNLEQRHRSIEMYAKRIVEKIEKVVNAKS